ncbi:hypothetical protein B7P43_G04066 [Cryptotermes secundus]|uniref:Fe2OG dioxygenase domain-containing protein n=1 Tax=Cryptotermes secundus TaxID=105785 RepID=A0A2J7QS83_9NEOP|nr:hypothetical protein B7P43_G04066 [Cryptotermes secundus]
MAENKYERKARRKQTKAKHILFQDTGISCSDEPTKYVMVANAGLVTGLQQEQLLELCLPYGGVDGIVMLPGKSYCFIIFKDILYASKAYAAIHGKIKLTPNDSGPLYLAYAEKVPELSHSWNYDQKPPGLILLEEFVTEDEEKSLLNCIDWKTSASHLGQTLKHRRVKHYGYEFQYDTNNVDKECPLSENIPSECNFLWDRLKDKNISVLSSFPTQLTVNHYQPGQGIPSHVDTHSAFKDPILSLSLGSSIVMEFRHQDGRVSPVILPQRSLLIMSEEARYWYSVTSCPSYFLHSVLHVLYTFTQSNCLAREPKGPSPLDTLLDLILSRFNVVYILQPTSSRSVLIFTIFIMNLIHDYHERPSPNKPDMFFTGGLILLAI